MPTKEKTVEVDTDRQLKAFTECCDALAKCSDEERRRNLAALVVLYDAEEDIAARIERNRRSWR